MRRRHRPVRALAAALWLCAAAAAMAAPEGYADYHHARWTAADGAPPAIRTMAQTRDGWLWLGTVDGLYRFDGLRFERLAPPAPPGRSRDRIHGLRAAPNGDLVIAYLNEGLSVLHPDGRIDDLPEQPAPHETVYTMAVDTDGSLWAVSGQVIHLVNGRWHVVATGPEWEGSRISSLVLDGAGRLWAFNDSGAWRLDRPAGRFVRMTARAGLPLLAPDGRLWQRVGNALHLVEDTGAARPPAFGASEARVAGQFDADGHLWLLNCPQPVCHVPNAAPTTGARRAIAAAPADMVADPGPLSGRDATVILEDREGDIWVATEGGLDRFRRNRFLRSGLPGSGARYSFAVDGGRVLAADLETGTLWRLAPDATPVAQRGPWVGVINNGPDGALLVGGKRSIQRRRGATVEDIPLPPGPDGKPRDHRLIGVLDDGKVLWTAALETGLIGWRDGRWLPRAAFNLPPKIYQSATTGAGAMWLATGDGKLVHYLDGKLTGHDLSPIGLASALLAGDELLASGTEGTAVLRERKLHLLHTQDPGVLRNLSGLVVTPDGDRWMNGVAGLVHVRAADWHAAMRDPAGSLRYELFDALDGYPGRAAFENRWRGIVNADGRNLWLSATGGVVRLDLAQLRRNRVAPQAVILDVAVADGRSWPARGRVELPAGTDQFRIQYTAPALRMPERVRFEYRLDGVDRTWLDAGTRRATSYTNIAPGDYVFRVRAVNEDGMPGEAVATLPLHVAPTLVQTLWFRLACAGALALLGVVLYRYRMRYVTRRLTERLQVKTAERERIARTLHDRFLQTVQGLVLRVDAVAATLPPDACARRQLEDVLDDASHAIGEGRDQLQELRAGDAHVLEDVLADAIARLRQTHGALAVDVHVAGERRPLLAAVADEIAEIAREALRNAFAHARASRIRITLLYERRTLTLCVADDGRGLPEPVRCDGLRSGHWGLVGMRERATHIGARLDIASGPRQGTTVTLLVPGTVAYGADRSPPM